MLQFKPTVRIAHFNEPLARMCEAASLWSLRAGIHVEVNSVEDSLVEHGATSLHRFTLAVDFDTVGDRPEHLPLLAHFLRAMLPADYDIRLEHDHVHGEYDAGWNRGVAGTKP